MARPTLIERGLDEQFWDAYTKMEIAVNNFEWVIPGRPEVHPVVSIEPNQAIRDPQYSMLVLTAYVPDNDHPENIGKTAWCMPINWYMPADVQIRQLIHSFLMHEVDEQMWFSGQRTFYPKH